MFFNKPGEAEKAAEIVKCNALISRHARRDIPAKTAWTKGPKWWILQMFSVGTDTSWNGIDCAVYPRG